MATDGSDLNKACPAILLDIDLRIYKGFFSKALFKILEFGTHWHTMRIHCGHPCSRDSENSFAIHST